MNNGNNGANGAYPNPINPYQGYPNQFQPGQPVNQLPNQGMPQQPGMNNQIGMMQNQMGQMGFNQPMNGQMPNQNPQNKQKAPKKDNNGLGKTVGLIVATAFAIIFATLSGYLFIQWNNALTDVEGQIEFATAEALTKQKEELQAEFDEEYKKPYLTFDDAPSDYGFLTFEFPKNWSSYIPKDGATGGEFAAYLNPDYVGAITTSTPLALRVSIVEKDTETVKKTYASKVKSGKMTASTRVVNGATVDIYTGEVASKLQGIVCVFKIRDKTAIIQTDASGTYSNDFYHVLDTIKFNA